MLLTFWTSFCDMITPSVSLLERRWITHISVSVKVVWLIRIVYNSFFYLTLHRPSSERAAKQLGYAKLHWAAANGQRTFWCPITSQQCSRWWYRSTNCHLTSFFLIPDCRLQPLTLTIKPTVQHQTPIPQVAMAMSSFRNPPLTTFNFQLSIANFYYFIWLIILLKLLRIRNRNWLRFKFY